MIFAIRTILNANNMDELPLVTSTADRSTWQPSGEGNELTASMTGNQGDCKLQSELGNMETC